jgi:hypothetical protein
MVGRGQSTDANSDVLPARVEFRMRWLGLAALSVCLTLVIGAPTLLWWMAVWLQGAPLWLLGVVDAAILTGAVGLPTAAEWLRARRTWIAVEADQITRACLVGPPRLWPTAEVTSWGTRPGSPVTFGWPCIMLHLSDGGSESLCATWELARPAHLRAALIAAIGAPEEE